MLSVAKNRVERGDHAGDVQTIRNLDDTWTDTQTSGAKSQLQLNECLTAGNAICSTPLKFLANQNRSQVTPSTLLSHRGPDLGYIPLLPGITTRNATGPSTHLPIRK